MFAASLERSRSRPHPWHLSVASGNEVVWIVVHEVTSGIITKTVVKSPKLVGLLPRFSAKWLQTLPPELIFTLAILTFQAELFCRGLRADDLIFSKLRKIALNSRFLENGEK